MSKDLFADEPKDLFAEEFPSDEKSFGRKAFDYFSKPEFSPLLNVASGIGTLLGKNKEERNIIENLPQTMIGREPSFGESLEKGIGEYLPFGLAGGGTIPGLLVAGAGAGARSENTLLLPHGKIGGAIEGALLNMLAPAITKGAEALRPSKMFRGQLPASQLKENIELTKGTETGLGDVIESPFLKKRLENTLTSLPFSGANESLQRTGEIVKNKGEGILQNLLGKNSPDNIPAQLTKELNSQFKIHQNDKNALYTQANELADKHGLKLELPNFAKKANDVSEAIEATNMLKFEPDIAKIFNKLKNYKNPVVSEAGSIVDIKGKPLVNNITTPSLKEANILKSKLREYSKTAAKSPDPSQRNMAKVFGELSSSLRSDIRSTISESGKPDLKAAYEVAEKNYKEKFSPFLDKQIYKYLAGGADPETIVQKFLKTSPNVDLAGQLEKLATKMSPQSRNLLAYSYLSRAVDNEGNLNPSKLGTAIQKLGKNQLKVLVPDPSLRKELLNYNKLQKMNKEAQLLMFNPKTGQRNTDTLMTGLLAFLGNMGAGNIGAIGAAGIPIVAGKYMTKALTSSNMRENLINEMLKNRIRFDTPLKRAGGAALTQSIAKQLEGNE